MVTIIPKAHTSNSTLPIFIKMILDEPHNQARIENEVMLETLSAWCQRLKFAILAMDGVGNERSYGVTTWRGIFHQVCVNCVAHVARCFV